MPDFDEPSDDDVAFVFERLDVGNEPGRYIVSVIHRSDFARRFRAVYAKQSVRVYRAGPRRWNHPDRLAEGAELRKHIHAAMHAPGKPS